MPEIDPPTESTLGEEIVVKIKARMTAEGEDWQTATLHLDWALNDDEAKICIDR